MAQQEHRRWQAFPGFRFVGGAGLLCAGWLAAQLLSPAIAQEAEPVRLHPDVAAERKKFDDEVARAAQPIQKRYTSRLKLLQKTLAKAGDEVGVAGVEAELERLGLSTAQQTKYPIEGVWNVLYSNDNKRTYRIGADGRVDFLDLNTVGRFTRNGDDVLVDFGDGKLERFYWKSVLAVEHYDPKTRYGAGLPNLTGLADKATP